MFTRFWSTTKIFLNTQSSYLPDNYSRVIAGVASGYSTYYYLDAVEEVFKNKEYENKFKFSLDAIEQIFKNKEYENKFNKFSLILLSSAIGFLNPYIFVGGTLFISINNYKDVMMYKKANDYFKEHPNEKCFVLQIATLEHKIYKSTDSSTN